MIIALASPRIAKDLDDGLNRVHRLMAEASAQGAEVVCFPEAYLPGLWGVDIDVLPYGPKEEERVLGAVSDWARTYRLATIFGTQRVTEAGRENVAVVFGARGELLGVQSKVQVAPSEDPFYVRGRGRRIFEVSGVKFGVAICHEGWRYPETVRWAAVRGARIVFHPQHTGSDREGVARTRWGEVDGPYYESAMRMRSIENTIYFASVNYALRYQESTTSLIDPSGECQAFLPYGEEGVLVQAIDVERASGLIAHRFAPDRHDGAASQDNGSDDI
jgi:predicted amidohydrolase